LRARRSAARPAPWWPRTVSSARSTIGAAINTALAKRGSPYKAIIAFPGAVDDAASSGREASFNGFQSSELEDKLDADPYRFLVVADKYLTGFDQPKLFAMYVDKTLAGVKAVQPCRGSTVPDPAKASRWCWTFATIRR
jgi:type I restriction enzyme R subunit